MVWSVAAACGKCFYCTHDLPQKCTDLFKYGHSALTASHGPAGGLATHCHLRPGTALVTVPPELPDEAAAPAMCATATAAAAMRAGGEIGPGGVVLLFGLGLLGLTACAMASVAGMTVIAVLCFFAGLILDTVTRGRREVRRLAYLSVSGPSAP